MSETKEPEEPEAPKSEAPKSEAKDHCEEFGHYCGRCDTKHIFDNDAMKDLLNRALEDNAELNRLFDLQQTRMVEASNLWREATGKHDTLPDLGALLAWLLERRTEHGLVQILRDENNLLRGLLAQGQGPCVYCQLPAEDIAKCPTGFPGCPRMDDIVSAQQTENERLLENRNLDLVELLRQCRESYEDLQRSWRAMNVVIAGPSDGLKD